MEYVKTFLEKIWSKKYIGGIILALLSIFSVIYYAICYCRESVNTLIFTPEHKFLLLGLACLFVSVAILYLLGIFLYCNIKKQNDLSQNKLDKIETLLYDLFENSINAEHNLIMVTRGECLNIIKSLKGDNNEKRI